MLVVIKWKISDICCLRLAAEERSEFNKDLVMLKKDRNGTVNLDCGLTLGDLDGIEKVHKSSTAGRI